MKRRPAPRKQAFGIATQIALAALLVSCSEPDANNTASIDAATESSADAAIDAAVTLESRPQGSWFAGDLHVHATGASNDTGGDSFPERIKEVAIERGLSWVTLTDHSNSTGSDPSTRDEDPDLFNMGPEFPYWMRVAELSEPDFLFIDGNELSPVDDPQSTPTGHVGCIPRDLETFDTSYVFVDRPMSAVTGGEALAQAQEAGCFSTVNHPYALVPWIEWDWTAFDYDAIEVYNGTAGWDSGDGDALKAWACDLSEGRRPTAVGGSDNHRVEVEPPATLTDPPLGYPATWVWAESLTWDNVIAALESGRVSVTDDGAPLELDAHDSEGAWLGMMGDTVAAEDLAALRLSGPPNSSGEKRLARLYKVPAGGCDNPRAPNVTTRPDPGWEIVWEVELADGESFEEVIEVTGVAGDSYFVWKGPPGAQVALESGAGFTNAIHVE